jgi:5-methyltetrahydropteroyltriglutamate--homocysteine methyltransferase
MFDTAIAGSLPTPAWLAETEKLWPKWKAEGADLAQAKLDATLRWIKAQEDAGVTVIGDGEQSRQHFMHGFLEQVEGIDFEHKVEMGIRADRSIAQALRFVPRERLIACTNCGLAPMSREVAEAKLRALAAGAALARQRQGAG